MLVMGLKNRTLTINVLLVHIMKTKVKLMRTDNSLVMFQGRFSPQVPLSITNQPCRLALGSKGVT